MQSIELLIGRVLRVGLIASVLIVLTGGVFYLLQNGHQDIHYQVFQYTSTFSSITNILHEAFTRSPAGIIQLGLLVLVLTQVLRVLLTIGLFLKIKDYLFTIISLIIFAILVYSIFLRN
jgi:uncharacterized membrane protein